LAQEFQIRLNLVSQSGKVRQPSNLALVVVPGALSEKRDEYADDYNDKFSQCSTKRQSLHRITLSLENEDMGDISISVIDHSNPNTASELGGGKGSV
jgi:hypothetical protein